MGLTTEQPKSVNEGEDVEKSIDERAPVQRLVMSRMRSDCSIPVFINGDLFDNLGLNSQTEFL